MNYNKHYRYILEIERNFEDLRSTGYLTNSKGDATDLKVGGDKISASEASQTIFRLTPLFWHSGDTQIE